MSSPHTARTVAAIDPKTVPTPAVQRFCTLPNGLEIACQSAKETEHIYDDIFIQRVYLSHGITLWDGATVFDVGGNIGLFTVFVHQCFRDVVSYTFEPAPPIFEILTYNTARHGGSCKLFPCGVSDSAKTAALTFYPYSSGMSSFYGDVEEEKDVLRRILENQTKAGDGEAATFATDPEEFLDARLTRVEVERPLLPLSEIIRQEGVETIDLLKIDVQKSELDVLYGLEAADWPKVRQIAIEVHDLDGQLDAARQLLAEQGFNVVVVQDPLYAGSVMYNLFAVRKDLYRSLGGARAEVMPPAGPTAGDPRRRQAFARFRQQRR